jgi:thiamine-phosphate pyrophosphorylase
MDAKLVGWARGVKARRNAGQEQRSPPLPPLWLFSDPSRLPDLGAALGRLPRGLAGVVLREALGPAELRRLGRVCRARRIALSVAGDGWLGPGMGRHLRRGCRLVGPPGAFVTSSAHDRAELRRALRAGAAVIFLSPVFPTGSHPGAPALGVLRWAAAARLGCGRVAALGGIDGGSVRRLPRWLRRAGAIGALAG